MCGSAAESSLSSPSLSSSLYLMSNAPGTASCRHNPKHDWHFALQLQRRCVIATGLHAAQLRDCKAQLQGCKSAYCSGRGGELRVGGLHGGQELLQPAQQVALRGRADCRALRRRRRRRSCCRILQPQLLHCSTCEYEGHAHALYCIYATIHEVVFIHEHMMAAMSALAAAHASGHIAACRAHPGTTPEAVQAAGEVAATSRS